VILALIGSTFGLIGALFVGRAMKSILYGVGVLDVRAFTGVALVLLAEAALACYIPARRSRDRSQGGLALRMRKR
jgi:putative ABC transport system permease protein